MFVVSISSGCCGRLAARAYDRIHTGEHFIELFGRKARIGKVKMDPLDAMVILRALAN